MDSSTLTTLLDTVSQGVVVFGADRKIVYCNQAFLDITGFDRSEMAGALCGIMQGPDTDGAAIAAIDAAIQARQAFSGEIQNYRKSGECFWNDLTFKPEFNADGSFRHFIGTSRDITKQKFADLTAIAFEKAANEKFRELEIASTNLQNAQRIAKFGIFDYSVKYDLGYWSDELIEMIGFPKENFPVPSSVFISLIDEVDLPRSMEFFDRAIVEGIPYEMTVKVHRYCGNTMYMQIIADVMDVEDDRRIIGIARDVTEENNAAEQLLQEKQRFELAARATQDVIFDWNIETGAYWANEAFETVYGYPAPSHVSFDALEEISAALAEHNRIRQITIDAVASGEERYAINYGFNRPDGSHGHVAVRGFVVRDETGKALRIIGTATDVSQLTDAMRALEASEERFRIIADTVSDVLWDCNLDAGTMWVTPDWPDRLHIAIEPDITYERFFSVHVEPEDSSRVEMSFLEAIKSDAAQWEIQFVLVGSDGARIDLAVRAAILRHPNGRAHRILGNARNVTMEKRQQEGYSRARALEAVGQLTGGVAHDFNNQLMIIQGNAELLEMSELDEDQAESVALINQACSGAADLTQRLLSFSRQSRLETERIDFAKLISNTVALLRVGIPETITIHCKVPAGIWQAKADANALEQAIVNLAVNARDAMPRGGDIVIGCENRKISRNMGPVSPELEPGDYVLVSVTDNGKGIPPEVLARVFEPFFTTKEVGKGSGLGLSTVYGFAEQSDGKVTIYSEPGEGTTVNLYLPRFKETLEEAAPEPDIEQDHQPQPGQRILVVEDQPMVRAHVEKLLSKIGYAVTTAEQGSEALSLLNLGHRFDLLFTDIIMPGGMNGQQLAEEAKKVDPRMKVLFTSGYPAFAFEHLGFEELDNLRLLRKPYRSIDLKAALAQVLGT